ncbi:MAG: nuclear transport factor 2 family protein [Parachlamydiaceae bacterium]|nr:nuclear transport factor 2 family protein [Parachlamydiaceae bacterium]
MCKNIVALAESYYKAMGEKNISEVEKFLHPDVTFIAPLAKTQGKEPFLIETKKFMDFMESKTIRAVLGSNEKQQAVVIYDVNFPSSVGKLHAASYLTFDNGLITKIELFYDARPFGQK